MRRHPCRSVREVLVRISHCGVCHSDLHLQDGYFNLGGGQKLDVRSNRTLPFTLGHEIAGSRRGERAGGGRRRAKGKRYAVYPWIGCGTCGLCARGDEHLCNAPRALGITVDGGYRNPRAGAASALSARRGGHCAGDRGAADVLGADRLRGDQEGDRLPPRRAAADRRPGRGRHDGPAVRTSADGQADPGGRYRCGQARGGARARRGGGVRSGGRRCAQGCLQGVGRRRGCGGRLRRLGEVAGLSRRGRWPRAARPSSSG